MLKKIIKTFTISRLRPPKSQRALNVKTSFRVGQASKMIPLKMMSRTVAEMAQVSTYNPSWIACKSNESKI